MRCELDNGDRSIVNWESVILKRFNDCNVKPRSQHDDITKYADPSLVPPIERSCQFLRKRRNNFRKACTRLLTNYGKVTGHRRSFAVWLGEKGSIDPETPSGQLLVMAAHLTRLGQNGTRWESVKRFNRSIDPKMKECYENGLEALHACSVTW